MAENTADAVRHDATLDLRYSIYGPIGRVTYVPEADEVTGLGQLHTGRVIVNPSALEFLQPFAQWYPASRFEVQNSTNFSVSTKHKQKRWLLNAHPEAYFADSVLDEVFAADNRALEMSGIHTRLLPLLAVGKIKIESLTASDNTTIGARQDVPVIASAAGPSGETLRLAAMDDYRWEWGADYAVNLFSIGSQSHREEVQWSANAEPISQIKFVQTDFSRSPHRWILVQKATSTTILSPELHAIPVQTWSEKSQGGPPNSSRIDPQPIETVNIHHTGGNPHSDVSFNPPSATERTKSHPQLAIIDQCGYWSVWDIMSRPLTSVTKAELRRCGHIDTGPLYMLPVSSSLPRRPHGILWIAGAYGSGARTTSSQSKKVLDSRLFSEIDHPLSRADFFVMWSSLALRAADLGGHSWTPNFPITSDTDSIVDVRLHPIYQNQIFVLTTSTVLWIEILPAGDVTSQSDTRFVKLLAVPHLRDAYAHVLRLTVCRQTGHEMNNVAFATIHSSEDRQINAYWFSLDRIGEPLYHHQLLFLSEQDLVSTNGSETPHTLCFIPAALRPKSKKHGTDNDIRCSDTDQDFGLQQILFLGQNLDVASGVAAIGTQVGFSKFPADILRSGPLQIAPKHGRVKQWRSTRARQTAFFQRFQDAFVMADDVAQVFESAASQGRSDVATSRPTKAVRRSTVHVIDISRFWKATNTFAQRARDRGRADRDDMAKAITTAARNALQHGRMPLKALLEYGSPLPQPPDDEEEIKAMNSSLDELFSLDGNRRVDYELARSHPVLPSESGFGYNELAPHLAKLWLDMPEPPPPYYENRRTAIKETAWDCTLATQGIMVKDIGDTQSVPPQTQDQDVSDGRAAASRAPSARVQSSLNKSIFKPQDGTSRTQSPASGSDSRNTEESVGNTKDRNLVSLEKAQLSYQAIKRLSYYATSIVPIERWKKASQHSILEKWPDERGVPTEGYISTVAESEKQRFEGATIRSRLTEARRARRADKYRSLRAMTQETESTFGRPDGEVGLASSQSVGPDLANAGPSEAATPGTPTTRTELRRGQQRGESEPASSQMLSQNPRPFVSGSQSQASATGSTRRKASQKRKSGFR